MTRWSRIILIRKDGYIIAENKSKLWSLRERFTNFTAFSKFLQESKSVEKRNKHYWIDLDTYKEFIVSKIENGD